MSSHASPRCILITGATGGIGGALAPAYAAPGVQGLEQHIWVLGCNHQDSHFLPLTSQLEPCSLARVSEGIRLWHQQPTALLHFSGRIDDRINEHSEVARRYAIAMGVAPEQIRLHQWIDLLKFQQSDMKLLHAPNNWAHNYSKYSL